MGATLNNLTSDMVAVEAAGVFGLSADDQESQLQVPQLAALDNGQRKDEATSRGKKRRKNFIAPADAEDYEAVEQGRSPTPIPRSSHVRSTPNPPAEAQHARVVIQARVQDGPMLVSIFPKACASLARRICASFHHWGMYSILMDKFPEKWQSSVAEKMTILAQPIASWQIVENECQCVVSAGGSGVCSPHGRGNQATVPSNQLDTEAI
ncbi:hypothetical protein N7461_002297 [Penicillium sp. DV-2018c]|nr:hypothetical protein N7461_002297 [Penicillium sp. DV-2018c]